MIPLPTPIAVVYIVGWLLASIAVSRDMTDAKHHTGALSDRLFVGTVPFGVGMGWPVILVMCALAWVGERL